MAHFKFTYEIASFSPFAEKIGEASLSWNNIQTIFFAFFVGFSGLPIKHASAVFYPLNSDRVQRNMVKRLGLSVFETMVGDLEIGKPNGWNENLIKINQVRDRFLSQIKNLEKMASSRNGIVHAALLHDNNGFIAVDIFNPRNASERQYEIFTKIDYEISEIYRAITECAEVFNMISEFFGWPETLLKL